MTDQTHVIKTFVVDEFMPDVPIEQLDAGEDLLAAGIIDSLGLLQVIVWLEDTFDLVLDDAEISPETFRSVDAISALVDELRPKSHATS